MDGPTRRVRTGTLLAVAAFVLLSQLSFGTFMNDEGGQLHGLHSLRQGSLGLEDRPEQFYALCVQVGPQLRCGVLPGVDTSSSTGSLVASVAALPAYYLFAALDPMLPPAMLLLLAWAVAAYVAALRVVPALHAWRTGRDWQWSRGDPRSVAGLLRTMTPSHAVLFSGILAVLVAGILTQPRMAYSTWGEVFAMQATHTAMTATAFVLFWRVAQRTAGFRAAVLASLLFLVGPIAFWGIGIKYHAPSVFLAVAALWLFQRRDGWRYAAFAVGIVGVANTELALPLLAAMVGVEGWRQVARARSAGHGLARAVAPLAAVVAVPVAGVALYNELLLGHWMGPYGAQVSSWSGLVAWMQDTARFDSWSRSWRNLWGVLVHSGAIEGRPVALLALSPLAALGLLAPWRMAKARCRDPVLWAAALSIAVSVVMAIHASHSQGTGFDNRFWVITVPAWLLLGAYVARPMLEDMDTTAFWAAARAWAIMGSIVLVVLWIFGSADIALEPDEPDAQLLNVSWLLGTVAWLALLAFALLGARMRAAWGKMRYERWLGRTLALAVLAPCVWLLMTTFIVHRSIPPWPFRSGREGISFLLPGLEELAQWATPHLIP